MGRRRNNILTDVNSETLSQENQEVQDNLLNDLLNDNQDNEVDTGSNEIKEMNNLSDEEKVEEIKEPGITFNVGDYVKLKKYVKFDLLGRRIHPGLRNYNYRILSIRIDGMLVIECLTHCFTVEPTDVEVIKL